MQGQQCPSHGNPILHPCSWCWQASYGCSLPTWSLVPSPHAPHAVLLCSPPLRWDSRAGSWWLCLCNITSSFGHFSLPDLQSPDGGAVTIFLLRCVVAVGGSEVLEAARCCHTVLSAPGAPLRLPSITLSQCLTSSRSISV